MINKLVIVGGVAGGASAATRARRMNEDIQIILLERGEYISFANCGLPYYIGGVIKERDDLIVTTPKSLKDRFNIDVRTHSEVLSIDPVKKEIKVKNHKTEEIYTESFDKLILSPGADPIKPPIPGINLDTVFTLRTIPDVDKIKEFVEKNKPQSAVVVGGGFIGLEMAENLAHHGIKVTIVEMLDQVLTPLDYEMSAIVHQYLRDKGLVLHMKDGVKAFHKEENKTVVETQSGARIPADMVLLAIGVAPENRLAKEAGLEIGKTGGIKVNEYMRTSDPDIYAVGDAIETIDFVTDQICKVPLAGPATKQGRIAADNAIGKKTVYHGVQGTSVIKIFDMTVGTTGNNEKLLKMRKIPYMTSYSHDSSHASYYPGAQMMSVKLLFSPDNGRILGAQIVGMEGVDKRIDVLATAIRGKMTVFDLEELELSYAPPFSSARDPVNVAGFIASNVLRGDLDTFNWNEIEKIDGEKTVLVDLRDKEELKGMGVIPGAMHIPVNRLRNNLSKFDKDKEYVLFCASGRRSYIGNRILKQKGFNVKNLSGGYKTFNYAQKEHGVEPMKNTYDNKEILKHLEDKPKAFKVDFEVNACGLQCPGPVMKLKKKMEEAQEGQIIMLQASDPGFTADIPAWCKSTGNELLNLNLDKGIYTAYIRKGSPAGEEGKDEDNPCPSKKEKTIIVFSNDLDRALAAFIIANGAASMGNKVTMFFTFWGLNILRKREGNGVKKDILSSMFSSMMPKGAEKLTLSKLNMMGLGTEMMKYVMKNKNVDSLDVLIKSAQEQGVNLVACTMTMEIMGIKREELIEGVREGGVASYLETADNANLNLFI